MNRQESGEDRYILGYSEEVMDMRNWRSAESCAAHLLPHLEAGFRILDFGCGNGSISMGLAKAVAPGELHGIDREESVIELARSAAAAGGYANANFHVGELTELPFEDNFFDAAHCHTVMLYVPDTQAALAEIKRVLKPGGILSCRERISASSFFEPNAADSWAVLERMLSASGTHPQMGKELKGAFHEAGFTNIRSSASFDFSAPPKNRMYPVIPGLTRAVANSFEFGGYAVPAGSRILIGNTVAHHNSSLSRGIYPGPRPREGGDSNAVNNRFRAPGVGVDDGIGARSAYCVPTGGLSAVWIHRGHYHRLFPHCLNPRGAASDDDLGRLPEHEASLEYSALG